MTDVADDPYGEFRAHQHHLRELVDQLDTEQPGTTSRRELFAQVTNAVKEVVQARGEVPLRLHQAAHDHYAARNRVVGWVLTVTAGLAALSALPGWFSSWLLLGFLPMLAVGLWLSRSPGGDRDRLPTGAGPRMRYNAGVGGVAAVVLAAAAALLWVWLLIPAAILFAATLACAFGIAKATPQPEGDKRD